MIIKVLLLAKVVQKGCIHTGSLTTQFQFPFIFSLIIKCNPQKILV